jgi:glycosyltransferase involved in cell wall biosynthesis/SAM-dependent methyltransferase
MQIKIMTRKISHPYLQLLHTQLRDKNVEIYECENRLDLVKGLRKVDIVHLHWIEGYFTVPNHKYFTLLKSFIFINYLIFVKYVARKKIVITLHNLLPHENQYPTIQHKTFELSLKLADAVIVHNNYSKKMACYMYNIDEKKIWIIPHGAFGSYYPNRISKEEARDILKIPKTKFVMLFFGGIRENKGIEEWLNILDDLLICEKDLFIVIAGACDTDNLKRRVVEFSNKFKQNSLVRIEYIPDEDVQIFMNASDVGILPYKEITTSGALLLYMSFKKPVIVSDLEPIKELLQNAGIYYKHGDSKDFQNIILKTKRGGYNLEELSQKVFEISQKYQWDNIAEKTIEAYENLISEQSAISIKNIIKNKFYLFYYRNLRIRNREKSLAYIRNTSILNTVLKTKQEVKESIENLKKLKLYPHGEQTKNWDCYRAFSFILNYGSPNSMILDVGSADYGVILPWLELYGYSSLFGCDITFKEDFKKGKIHYSKQDLQKTNFKSGSFDFITSISVIEHGVYIPAYLKEMSRLLKPGGYLLTSTDYWPEPIDTKGLYPYGKALGEMKIFTQKDIEELVQIAQEYGLELTYPIDFLYKDRVVYWERVDKRFTFILFVLRKKESCK